MLKIRLTRRGKKNSAFFRLVVAEHTSPVKGRFIESLGFINPHTKENKFNEESIKGWIAKGAQCSDTAHNLLVKVGIVRGPKRAVKMKKKPEEVKAEEPAQKPAAAAAPVAEKPAEENAEEEAPVAEEKMEKAE